ncbi:MAG TPA: alpha/beta hydrolase, partial [Thermoleophilaceae bacterium]
TPSGVGISAHASGPEDGPPVVALHGVMQTYDSVLKDTMLVKAGLRVIAYDARGHGGSESPGDRTQYGYDRLVEDLVAVMDAFGASPAVLVGVSMGALTAMRLAVEQPERVAGLVAVTPAYDPAKELGCMAHAERVADALRARDVDALMEAEPVRVADPEDNDALRSFARRTAERTVEVHRDADAAAEALLAILRARPFETFEPLAAIQAPTVVVGSRDVFDLNHPLHIARAYADAIPGSRFVCEDDEGSLPIAWRGREVAKIVLDVARGAGFDSASAPLGRSHR